ncbi:MAG: hypothetical protein ACXVZN_07910, partial [Gaiellaceae bacterium]
MRLAEIPANGFPPGLRARTKFLLTALVAVAYLWWISGSRVVPVDVIFHMSGYVLAVPHWLWLL